MNSINKLASFCDNRVKEYGAQYRAFAIFGLFNYPLAFLYEYFVMHTCNGFIVRFVSTLLCLGLLFKDRWPTRFKKYLALYWYITLIYSISFLAAYITLKGGLSLALLINFNLGVAITILLVDVVMFFIVYFLGISLALFCFYISGKQLQLPNPEHFELAVYLFVCIILLGTIFSRNKEVFEHARRREQQRVNESLEKLVQQRTEELIEKNRLLEEAIIAKSRFMNNMSHEIRTPVHGFMAISEGLAQHWDLFDDSKKKMLAIKIADSAKRLGNLLGHLLDLAKFNEGKMVIQPRDFNLIDLVNNMIEEAKVLYIRDKDITLNFNQTGCVMMHADAERISQVLRNIVTNATKFSPNASEINIDLKETALDGNKAIEITIKDHGIGIPEQELESIFDPFVESSKTATKAGGTGLGLAIVREIVTLHHGKVFALNNKDAGATFHIILPIKEISLGKGL